MKNSESKLYPALKISILKILKRYLRISVLLRLQMKPNKIYKEFRKPELGISKRLEYMEQTAMTVMKTITAKAERVITISEYSVDKDSL